MPDRPKSKPASNPPRKSPFVSSYGCMRGAVVVAAGIDLTEPLNADTDAARGIAYRSRDGKDVGYGGGLAQEC